MPAQVPRIGVPAAASSRSGSASPSRSIPSVIVVDSPPGITSPSRPVRSAGMRTSRTSAPSSRSMRACACEVALQGEDADQRHARYQPRLARSCCSSSLRVSSETIALPRPSEARATRAGSSKCVVASTIAARAGAPGRRT